MTTATPAKAKRPNFMKYRLDRKNYWIAIGLLAAAQLGLTLFLGNAGSGMLFVWVLVYGWRLHDFGRSAWWGVGAMALSAAVPFVIVLANDKPMMIGAAVIAAFLVQAIFTVVVGSVRGDRYANRYHDMPQAKPRAAEVF